MVFRASLVYTSALTVHCMGNFRLVRQMDQQRRERAVRFYSRWYIMSSGVGVLARKIKLAMKVVVEL